MASCKGRQKIETRIYVIVVFKGKLCKNYLKQTIIDEKNMFLDG